MDRILTIPNAISAARLAGVPVFLWLVLGPRTAAADYWAVALLIVVEASSDWLDGKIARAFNQGSRLGEVLNPAADRLYIAATIVALGVRAIIPWWLIAVLALRELTVGVALVVLRRRAGVQHSCRSASSARPPRLPALCVPLAVPWRSPRLGRDARPGY